MTEPRSTVFISYSHKDEKWKDRLVTHLRVLESEGLLDLWEDRRIRAGSDWRTDIGSAIASARVALLLISPDFLTSNFILTQEIPPLLEGRDEEGVLVFPVIVRDCAWTQIPWLSALQARPLDGQPLSRRRGRLDSECRAIAEEVFELLRAAPPSRPPADDFLAVFRQRQRSAYSRWDLVTLGVARGSDQPLQADLDDMYLPLRLAEGFFPDRNERGRPIAPADLIERKDSLVLRGPAGCGKTTWMRWTFRQLLKDDGAVPLMLVLRDLSRRWQDPACQGAERSLDDFLEDWVTGEVGTASGGELAKLLAAESGPRPVLLVDGWDEMGPLGEELRRKLIGLREHYPRLLVVVTSRPYGEGRPSDAEGFEVLDVQPLSDAEIRELTYRFFRHWHGDEDAVASEGVERFLQELARSQEAKALARTALFLTIMLSIGRSLPVPDKRHLLYEVCIENLLTARPDRRKSESVLSLREQWCPPDAEERLRIVAALAYALQSCGYEGSHRSTIVQTWDEMAALLPPAVPEKLRMSFLAWLAGPAGLLADRTDGTLAFSHLSFQEYLAALHLNETFERAEERIQAFSEHLGNVEWWETLRLWAALLEKASPGRLDPVLTALNESEDGLALAGTLFAEGLGQAEPFAGWLARLLETLRWSWPGKTYLCARSWSASRQEERREEIARGFTAAADRLTWMGWLRYRDFLKGAALEASLPPPANALSRSVLALLAKGTFDRESVAGTRILCSGPPIFPTDPLEIGLLHLWPGHRRISGLRIQAALAVGAGSDELPGLATALLPVPTASGEQDEMAAEFARYFALDPALDFAQPVATRFANDLGRYFARYVEVDFVRDCAHYFALDFARFFGRYFGRDLTGDMSRDFHHYLTRYLARGFGLDFGRYFARYLARDLARNLTREFARHIELDLARPWSATFVSAELMAFGRCLARPILTLIQSELPVISLLGTACRLSYGEGRDESDFAPLWKADSLGLDPLWPALARHLARCSTPGDRLLLTDLALHPEKREPPLSWGLQFIVRGDVMREDGSVATLDELADQAGLPRLPYLEDLPDELEVDLRPLLD